MEETFLITFDFPAILMVLPFPSISPVTLLPAPGVPVRLKFTGTDAVCQMLTFTPTVLIFMLILLFSIRLSSLSYSLISAFVTISLVTPVISISTLAVARTTWSIADSGPDILTRFWSVEISPIMYPSSTDPVTLALRASALLLLFSIFSLMISWLGIRVISL